jgi:tartrate dehydrogenase/decarboxylase/D-malate dehydrogenase
MAYQVAVLPGDGIGHEVIDATTPLLRTVSENHGFDLEFTQFDWGGGRHIEEGSAMPADAIETLEKFDAILHGATGHPDVPDTVGAHELVLPIRRAFDQHINLRPAFLYNPDHSVLEGYDRGAIDIQWFRENIEGEYADVGGPVYFGGQQEIALQCGVFTRNGVERIVQAACEAALDRTGKVTSITKSNAQRYGPVLWDEVVEEVSEDYPDVEVERMLVDAAAYHLVRSPEKFDVVVASNLFSDILTDLTAGITGSLGLAASANYNPDNDEPGMFEPVHGSAPDIAGKGIANPVAEIMSGSLLLGDIGEQVAADNLWEAIEAHLTRPDAAVTSDLGGNASTSQVATAIEQQL